MKFRVALVSATVATAAAFALVAAIGFGSGSAKATPAYAQQTKLGCPSCHAKMPPSASALTPTGEKFKANGHKM